LYIYNDVANAKRRASGRPAGSAVGASFSAGEFPRDASGSALWTKGDVTALSPSEVVRGF